MIKEGLITGAQDRALNTRYYSKHITKRDATDMCHVCHHQLETVEHITSVCLVLAAEVYPNRHNYLAAQLYLDIGRHYGVNLDVKTWYEHEPGHVLENEQAKVLEDTVQGVGITPSEIW